MLQRCNFSIRKNEALKKGAFMDSVFS